MYPSPRRTWNLKFNFQVLILTFFKSKFWFQHCPHLCTRRTWKAILKSIYRFQHSGHCLVAIEQKFDQNFKSSVEISRVQSWLISRILLDHVGHIIIWVARSQEIHDPSPNIIEPLTGSYTQYTNHSQLGEKPPTATILLEYVFPPILTM